MFLAMRCFASNFAVLGARLKVIGKAMKLVVTNAQL
jgi:hypothetical protein